MKLFFSYYVMISYSERTTYIAMRLYGFCYNYSSITLEKSGVSFLRVNQLLTSSVFFGYKLDE